MIAKQINLRPFTFWEALIGWLVEYYDLIYSVSLWELYKQLRRQWKKPGRLTLTISEDSRGRRYRFIRIMPESCLWPMVEGKPFYKYRIYKMTLHVPSVQIVRNATRT